MNATTAAIVWMALQVFLFTAVGGAAFLVLRRRGPSAAGVCAALVLGLTVPIVLVMISPWPRWNSGHELFHIGSGTAVTQEVQSGTHDSSVAVNTDTGNSGSMMGTISTWWKSVIDLLEPTAMPGLETQVEQSWAGWIPWILATGIGLGLVRLVAGMWAIRRLRRSAKMVDDVELVTEIRKTWRELGALEVVKVHRAGDSPARMIGGRTVRSSNRLGRFELPEVRETSLLRSAATVGWRRPVILLPEDWRSWTETERRSVFAHELVHIARRDFFTGIVARIAAVVHFYQPLVLWLGRELRIQQELAADSVAAEVAGSRQVYLTTLAQMALRADERPMPWGARAFLPGTSMLIKRVAWLKRGQGQKKVEKSLSQRGKWLMGVAMVAIALGVAGIRGPESSSARVAMGAEPEQKHADTLPKELHTIGGVKKGAESKWDVTPILRTFKYVPTDAKLIVGLSPSEIAKWSGVAPFVAMIDKEAAFEKKFGLKISDVANVEFVRSRLSGNKPPPYDRLIVQTKEPHDWKKMILENGPPSLQAEELDGKQVFADPSGPMFYMADDRTMIVGSKEEIKKIIGGGEKEMTAEEFPEFLTEPVAVRVEMSLVKAMTGLDKLPQSFESNPMAAMFLPLVDHVKVECGYVDAQSGSDKAGFHARLECDSGDGAQQVAKTLEALRTVGLNVLQAKFQAMKQTAPANATAEQTGQINQFFDMVVKSLTEAKITAADKQVRVSADLDVNQSIVAGVVMPAVAASREAAMRNQSMSNMKMLGLAMYMYENAEKHFPPAAIRDKDGKPLLSWRVGILPYLDKEEQSLYKEFHLDESWDSEYNKPLIAKMPAVFRDPHDAAASTNSSYFMPTGKGMFGGFVDGIKVRNIMDGTSKTICLVEAKRDIPWTKPEDIEIDADSAKPLPELGGHMIGSGSGIFAFTFADGHVEIISKEIGPKELHAMFTVAGGEAIRLPPDAAVPSKAVPVVPPTAPSRIIPVQPPTDQSGMNSMKIEFHRAENEPGAGLSETTALDRTDLKIYLHPEAELTNADIVDATATKDDAGHSVIMVSFTAEGAEKMAKLSEENIGKPMVIMVDGKVLSAPVIRSRITGGKAQIAGIFTPEDAERIAKGIRGK